MRCGGCSGYLAADTPVSHPSPRIRVCTPVCAEAVRSCDLCSGFEPAKALLPSLVRGRPFATGGSWERCDPGWDGVLGGKNTIGRVGCYMLLPAQPFMLARLPKCVCASVQRLALGRSRTVLVGVSCKTLPRDPLTDPT